MSISYRNVWCSAGQEYLSGCFVGAEGSTAGADILFLHGGRRASKERCLPLALTLAEDYHLSSFAFDFSGHGCSTGSFAASSLKKRVAEASGAALACGGVAPPSAICGISMGAHVALELVTRWEVDSLLLIAPVVYADDAYDVPFGSSEFAAIVGQSNSWRAASVLKSLEEFGGNLLIVAGERDQLLPREALDRMIGNAASAAKKRLMVIPDAPHRVLCDLFRSAALLEDVCETIVDYVGRSAGRSA